MQKQQYKFKRNTLAIAIGVAMLGGVSGCNENDPIAPDALGEFSIVANGGSGGMVNGSGGSGGGIDLNNEGGSGGVAISQRGTANTKFTTPIKPGAVNLGANPLTIAADTTIDYIDTVDEGNLTVLDEPYVGSDGVLRTGTGLAADYATDVIVAAGTVYLNDGEVFVSGGTAAADVAYTGLSVAAGTTLTLGGGCSVDVGFTNDIDNSGTITRVIESEGCSLYLRADKYMATGNVVNAGNEDFENGGYISITASNGIVNSGTINSSGFDENNDVNGDEPGGQGGQINLNAAGYILNSGMLDASGGDGKGSGGYSNGVYINAAYIENTADIDSSGGNNVSDPLALVPGSGGGTNSVYMSADYGVMNTGNIDNSGGDGSSGGYGNQIQFNANDLGEVKNSGNLNTSGGHALEVAGGNGGEAGSIYMTSRGADLLNSGDLTAVGGNSTGNASAGYGGYLQFYGYNGAADTTAGDVQISGDINTSGGGAGADGSGSGGYAGNMYLYADANDKASEHSVALLGYVSIDANGGDGRYGGAGASSDFDLYADYQYDADDVAVAGSASNDVPINARGGNGRTDSVTPAYNYGGYGGEIYIGASTSEDVASLEIMSTNTAAIDLSGGNASADSDGTNSAQGGQGGSLAMYAYHGANNSGAVNVSGGSNGQNGGYGGEIGIWAEAGKASNSGVITGNGGTGAQNGGYGADIGVFGLTAANSGAIAVNGGNATSTDELVTTYGGDGGYVGISGLGLGAAATNTGNVTYSFGTGDNDGDEGCLQVGLTFTGAGCSGSGPM